MITDINQLDLNKRYTYADYLTWQFDEMVELIKGKVYRMTPAPSLKHQRTSGNLYGLIWTFLKDKQCECFSAPFDVRLPLPPAHQKDNKIDTVVQPDICVVCDESKLDRRGCTGAPDWIIEILSLATSRKDLTEKFDLYQHAGVREYWIIHPTDETVIPYRLNEQGIYVALRPTPFSREETIQVGIFEDFEMELTNVF